MADIPSISGARTLVGGLLRPLGISASGLHAQQRRIAVIAENIANAETTRTADGGPYRRRVVDLQPTAGAPGVSVGGIREDPTAGTLVYDPSHPDADANGFVRMPNVDVTSEMVDLMVARRMYEANATVFATAKAMLRRALDI